MRLFWLWGMSIGIAAGPLSGQTQVSLVASTTTATVGDPIELRFIVKTGSEIENVRIGFPVQGMEVLKREKRPIRDFRELRTFETVITVAFFKTGDFSLGPFAVDMVKAGRVVESKSLAALAIRIRSVLQSTDQDIQPLKKPLIMKGNPWYLLKYALALLAVLLALSTVCWLLRRRKKKEGLSQQPALKPEQELERALQELLAKGLIQRGEIKFFFILLADIFKRFLGRYYDFAAEDSTTSETLESLKVKESDGRVQERFGQLFLLADRVKFARHVPARLVMEGLQVNVEQLLRVYQVRAARELEVGVVQPGE